MNSRKFDISTDYPLQYRSFPISEIHHTIYPVRDKEMFKQRKTYKVSKETMLDKIFVDGLPINGFIDKGRCAIGGTYLEIMNKDRCSIITVPNISILLCKKESHPEIDIVYGDKTFADVEAMLTVPKPSQKIMTTPEGFIKIMSAAEVNGRTNELYSQWFLLLDEAHTFISEHYRDGILSPFNHFWNFTNKAIISATPYMFSNRRFDELTYHKIEFTESLGTVKLVNATSPDAVLNYILKNYQVFPGSIHIFYNSVRAIRDAILRSYVSKEHFNIYCANDDNGQNLKNLGDLRDCYVVQPQTGHYNRINFYTSRYFEGWDLFDDEATLILVTDIYKPHTVVGVGSKGKQAIGRLRNKAAEIIHITNHKYIREMKTIESYKTDYLQSARLTIDSNNALIDELIGNKLKTVRPVHLEKFADIDKDTNKATLNYMKLDQQINEAANNEIYNHIGHIEQDWKNAFFEVRSEYSDLRLETLTSVKRKSAAKQLEDDYKALKAAAQSENANGIFNINRTLQNAIKKNNPVAYDAWTLLDEATLCDMKYNVKKVRSAIILKQNASAETKLLRLLNETFTVGAFYTNEDIKNKLQGLYSKLNLREDNGTIKVAKANEINTKGWFEATDTKQRVKGSTIYENGKIIIRAQFNLRMAA